MSTSQDCSSANLANEVDFAEIQYYCIKQMNIVNLRQRRYNASNFAVVYLQSFNYHSPNRHFEDVWCEVIADSVYVRLIVIDVQLGVSDLLSIYDKSSCANVYTFPGKYTNFYRLEEVANLTNHFYVHFKGYGVFWIAFKSENRRMSMNCGTLNADCNKNKINSTTSSPKVQKSTQVPWWVAVLGGILVCFLTVLYLYKRHRSKQKIETDQDLEPEGKGLYPSIFSVMPSEKSAPPSVSSFPKNNGLPKYSVSVRDE
ncbi:uncharacterized protein LOC134281908 [Saccostrea cucullata]|uniref:uncharacterized protein LOC134281908 n=1 Tax=Saccostrea cuccullata TaxID=36930 RepID=UPI002ED3B1B8